MVNNLITMVKQKSYPAPSGAGFSATCGHKTFGVKWLFEHTATHQLSVSVDRNTARSPKRFIPQNRCTT